MGHDGWIDGGMGDQGVGDDGGRCIGIMEYGGDGEQMVDDGWMGGEMGAQGMMDGGMGHWMGGMDEYVEGQLPSFPEL